MGEEVGAEFAVLGRRHKPKVGDVFRVQLNGTRLLGRVVKTDAQWATGGGSVNLIYVYRAHVRDPSSLPTPSASVFLGGPFLINNKLWSRGHAEHVVNRPLKNEEILPMHCFWSSVRKEMVDEMCQVLKDCPVDVVGEAGLHSHASLADELSRRLSEGYHHPS